MKIGITGIIVVVMMLAMVPGASAWAFEAVGNITYDVNSTNCPYGWDAYMVNHDDSYPGEPWYDETHSFIFWDYKIVGESTSDDHYVTVNVTSPDGRWFGERTYVRLGDVYDTESMNYIIDLVVSEVPVEPDTFTKSLPLGWNLISLPLTPLDNSASAVLSDVSQDAVKSYNAATHLFEDVTTMDPGTGYFVHVTTAGDWVYEGTAYESMTATLSQGLNMVGWTNTNAALPDALSSIAGSYRYVAHWNATSQGYEVYEPNAPTVFNDFTTMERGEGYFIAATEGCTLTYP